MNMDLQMDLINLASGHPPRKESHPHGCGCRSYPSHAPFCTNVGRKMTLVRAIWPKLLEGVEAPDGHGFANGPDKPCLWTSPKEGKPSPWLWLSLIPQPCPVLYKSGGNFDFRKGNLAQVGG